MDSLSNNLISTLTGGGVRPPLRKNEKPREQESRRSPRAALNFIPDSDLLASLITQARQALAKGLFWDRGSIVNILL